MPNSSFAFNTVALLFFAVLVALMQPGFALLEAGLHGAKNVVNIFMKNIADFAVAGLAFWAVGFAIMYGAPLFISGYTGEAFAGQADFSFNSSSQPPPRPSSRARSAGA